MNDNDLWRQQIYLTWILWCFLVLLITRLKRKFQNKQLPLKAAMQENIICTVLLNLAFDCLPLSACLCVCLSVCLSVCLFVCLSVCLSVCLTLSAWLYVFLFAFLSPCQLSLCLLACLFAVCLFGCFLFFFTVCLNFYVSWDRHLIWDDRYLRTYWVFSILTFKMTCDLEPVRKKN